MTIARAFIAAPVLVLAYGVIRIVDGFDGSRGPGLAWTAGHLAFLAAMALFVPIFLALRKLAGSGRFATVAAVVGLIGTAAFTVQFGIDVVAGFLASDHAEMGDLIGAVSDIPGLSPVVYAFGPILFYAGQVMLMTQLAVQRAVKVWVPLLVFVDMMLPMVDRDLIPLGAVFLLIAFLPLARTLTGGRPATLARYAA